jgi:hypothetical protein
MADIDQIIAGGAGASSRVDFSKLADLPSYYWKGRDEYAKNDLRDAFRDGVPIGADGQPDFAAISKTFFQKGDVSNGIAAANLDLQRQNLKFGQAQSRDIATVEGGGQPGQPPIVSPPSPNRSGTATVAPPLNRGGAQPALQPTAQASTPQGGSTIMQILTAQGIPNDQLGAASASVARQLGVEDPNAPIDVSDPRVRNVIVPAIQQLKRMGIGQVVPNGPAPAPQPQVAQAAPQGQPSPVTSQVTSATAPQTPSRAEQLIAYYSGIMSDPRSPKQNVELAKTRLEALQKSNDLTPDQKNYAQAKLEGFQGTFQDFLADAESRKTAATEEAKLGAQKYQSLVEAGTKAQMEIPQLDLLKEQMNDPNFFSGAGEKYNLLYKRLKSAVGIDPEAAVPQEYLRKATAANVLSSLGALKGLGQIRVAEINMAREAAASPENSIPANKLLVEISKRTHERNAQIAEMAQDYKEKNGVLDAGFDKQVTAYYKKNPLFTDAEIKDWHKVIGEQKSASVAPSGAQRFASPADVHAAVAAGKLKSGDSFVDGNGKTRYVP